MPADRNPTTKRNLSASASDVGLHQSKRTKRLSSTNDTRKRKYSEVQQSSSTDDVLRKPKQLVLERPSSTNIHDIPKELLVEILCRLPCAKSVFQCKCVSKSWGSLVSGPYFVGRFLWLQREKQTPIPGTIINEDGEELVSTDLFARFRSFKFKEKSFRRLKVAATWNDLVLCKETCNGDEDQYYICNPRTMQLVSLPATSEFSWGYPLPVGFICEPFYYEEEKEDTPADNSDQEEERKVIKIDAEYKWKVVRIIPPDHNVKLCFEFKIEVFSSETGEWRESLVSCPRGFDYSILQSPIGAFAFNGMLYWNTEDGDLLGLGPLMINNKLITCSSNCTPLIGDSRYQFHVIKLVRQGYEDKDIRSSYHLQAHHGRLQLVHLVPNDNKGGATLFVWELEKEELEQMAVQGGGELGQKHRKRYDIMNGVNFHYITWPKYFGFDPNDLDTCFVSLTDSSVYKCNIHTGEYSMMEMGDREEIFDGKASQIMLPWWPTPKPTIRSKC